VADEKLPLDKTVRVKCIECGTGLRLTRKDAAPFQPPPSASATQMLIDEATEAVRKAREPKKPQAEAKQPDPLRTQAIVSSALDVVRRVAKPRPTGAQSPGKRRVTATQILVGDALEVIRRIAAGDKSRGEQAAKTPPESITRVISAADAAKYLAAAKGQGAAQSREPRPAKAAATESRRPVAPDPTPTSKANVRTQLMTRGEISMFRGIGTPARAELKRPTERTDFELPEPGDFVDWADPRDVVLLEVGDAGDVSDIDADEATDIDEDLLLVKRLRRRGWMTLGVFGIAAVALIFVLRAGCQRAPRGYPPQRGRGSATTPAAVRPAPWQRLCDTPGRGSSSYVPVFVRPTTLTMFSTSPFSPMPSTTASWASSTSSRLHTLSS
jgi:hypothetical protein